MLHVPTEAATTLSCLSVYQNHARIVEGSGVRGPASPTSPTPGYESAVIQRAEADRSRGDHNAVRRRGHDNIAATGRGVQILSWEERNCVTD